MPKKLKGQAKVLTHDEFKRLLRFVSTGRHSKRNTLMILLSFSTGMRVSEIASLRVYDVIDNDDRVKEETTLQQTKEKKPKPIFFCDPRVKKAISEYISERKNNQKKVVFSYSHPLFLSQKKGGFSAKNMQKLFEQIYKKAGMIGMSSHSGRRTFATRLIEVGTDIKTISTLMGHSSVAMTSRYVEANPIRMKRVVAKALY